MKPHNPRLALVLIVLTAMAIRFLIAFGATEANDDHSEYIQIILNTGELPETKACWECFQPPLFYMAHAQLARILDNWENVELHRQMQWVNFLFSGLMVLMLVYFTGKINMDGRLRVVLLAFFLWNPRLSSMSVQATNDSILFLLGTVYLIAAEVWLRRSGWRWLALVVFISVLAASIKGNGILLLIMLPVLVYLGRRTLSMRKGIVVGFAIVGSVSLAFFSGGYFSKYRELNDPFVTNMERVHPPPIFEQEEWFGARPGIRSVRSGYFSFRLVNLLQTPYQINDEPDFPEHRTSFFTLLYGNFYHAQFASHPGSWQAENGHWAHQTARALYVLGLVPLLVFLIGILRFPRSSNDWLHLLCFGTFLLFLIKYSYDYRDFAHVKVLFLFPATLSMFQISRTGLEFLRRIGPVRNQVILRSVVVVFWLINILFLFNSAGLIQTLFFQG